MINNASIDTCYEDLFYSLVWCNFIQFRGFIDYDHRCMMACHVGTFSDFIQLLSVINAFNAVLIVCPGLHHPWLLSRVSELMRFMVTPLHLDTVAPVAVKKADKGWFKKKTVAIKCFGKIPYAFNSCRIITTNKSQCSCSYAYHIKNSTGKYKYVTNHSTTHGYYSAFWCRSF